MSRETPQKRTRDRDTRVATNANTRDTEGTQEWRRGETGREGEDEGEENGDLDCHNAGLGQKQINQSINPARHPPCPGNGGVLLPVPRTSERSMLSQSVQSIPPTTAGEADTRAMAVPEHPGTRTRAKQRRELRTQATKQEKEKPCPQTPFSSIRAVPSAAGDDVCFP